MLLFDVKKVLLITLIVIFGCLSAFGIYWFFFRSTPGDEYGQEVVTEGEGGELPSTGTGLSGGVISGEGGLPEAGDTGANVATEIPDSPPDVIASGSNTIVLPVVEDKVTGVSLSADKNGMVYYNKDDGRFYRLSMDGAEKYLLSREEFNLVENVVWAPSKNKAIMEYPDGSNVYYDFTKNKAVTLPNEMEEPIFSNTGDKIAFKFETNDAENNWLVVSNPDGEAMKAIEPVGDRGYLVQAEWSPNSQVVGFYHKSVALNKEEVFLIGQNGENFKSFEVEGMGFTGIWSPKGDKILYHVVSALDDYKPVLWVVDGRVGNIGSNNFNLGLYTWVDKCTFSADGSTVYCAVPKELSTGAGLYPDLYLSQPDVFYSINLATGLKKLIANPVLDGEVAEFNVGQVITSADGKYLIFWDRISEKVYRMRLK